MGEAGSSTLDCEDAVCLILLKVFTGAKSNEMLVKVMKRRNVAKTVSKANHHC